MVDLIDDSTNQGDLIDDTSNKDLDESVPYYDQLVGDDKPFKDVESLAKGKHESNLYINRLEGELRELRKELDKRLTLEEFADKMNNSGQGHKDFSNQDGTSDESGQHNQNDTAVPMTEDDIRKVLSQEITNREEVSARESNLAYVTQKAEEVFGSDYKVRLGQRAKDLGLGKEFLTNLAQTDPKAFLKIMVDENPARTPVTDTVVPPVGGAGPDMPANTDTSKNWHYYEKIRKDNPRQYFSVKIQNEMHSQAAKMGEAFYN